MLLDREFFNRNTIQVAQDLIGKIICFNDNKLMITETEAYRGENDEACHAARGVTKRTEVMFGEAGYTYVYLIYGMHYCLNIVTEEKGIGAAVLIRGARSVCGSLNFNGPGKLCRFLNISKEHNAIDLCNSQNFYVEDYNLNLPYISTPRIGISKAKEHLWRFIHFEGFYKL